MSAQRIDPRTRLSYLDRYRFRSPGDYTWRPLVFQNKEGQWQINPHAPVTSEFGNRKHPISGDLSHHNGIDIGLESGTRLGWKGEGNLQAIKDNPNGAYGGYGNLTLFQPAGADFSIKSAHLNKLPMGNLSDMGLTDLGFVGSTGRSTGPHLHLEVLGQGVQGEQKQSPPANSSQQQQTAGGSNPITINVDISGLLQKLNGQQNPNPNTFGTLSPMVPSPELNISDLAKQLFAQAASRRDKLLSTGNNWDLG